MDKEIWKDIEGYEGLYQVSNFGKIKSLPKFINNNSKSKKIGYYSKEKILKPFYNPKGYLLIKLFKNNKNYTKKIHRLVAQAFVPNLNNLPQVNHKDGNKQNNKVNNLEWCTNKENQIHAWQHNLQKRRIGKDNPLSKKVYQYDLIGNFIKEWNSIQEVEKNLKISNISSVCYGKRKTAGGYIWRYDKQW